MKENPYSGSKNDIGDNTYYFSNCESSVWKCEGFGIHYRPKKWQEPNWFWRQMHYLFFGLKWKKDS